MSGTFREGVYIEYLRFNIGEKVGAATGDIMYFDGEEIQVLAAGAAGDVVTSAGPGLAPVYGPAGGVIPDPLNINRVNLNELGVFTNPSGDIEIKAPVILDYVDTNLRWGAGAATSITVGTNLTALGSTSLVANTIGSDNTAVGTSALTSNVAGDDNTAVGSSALTALTGGSNNTSVGSGSGVTGVSSGNTNIGEGSGTGAGVTDTTTLGRDATSTISSNIVIGAGSSTTLADTIIIGTATTPTAAGDIQLGPNAVLGAGIFRVRSQIIADESWIGGGLTYTRINNAGDIVRLAGDDLPMDGEVGERLTVTTIDATPTVMQTYATVANSIRRITAKVTARRTAGGGAANDTYSVILDGLIKNDGGVVTTHTTTSTQIKDVAAWVIEYNIVGASVELRVTGTAATTIDWVAYVRKFDN